VDIVLDENDSLRLVDKPHRKDLMNIRKEDNSFMVVYIEQQTKFQCYSCYRLAQNKRGL
jgi:hypothetical protein